MPQDQRIDEAIAAWRTAVQQFQQQANPLQAALAYYQQAADVTSDPLRQTQARQKRCGRRSSPR